MGVASAEVGSAGDDTRSIEAALVGNVPDSKGVLVGGIANVLANILGVRSLVDEALDVVSITIGTGASSSVRASRVVHVDKNNAGSASRVTGLGANGDDVVAV